MTEGELLSTLKRGKLWLIILDGNNARHIRIHIERGATGILIEQVLGTQEIECLRRTLLIVGTLWTTLAQDLNERVADGMRAVNIREFQIVSIVGDMSRHKVLRNRFSPLLRARGQQQQGYTYYYIYTFHLAGIFLRTSSR